MESKSFLASKTVWLNIAMAITACVDLFTDTFPEQVHVAKYLLFGAGIMNIFMRTLTSRPVRMPGQPGESE